MSTKRIDPYYCTLSQPDMDTLTELVERFGYTAVLGGLADILTQKLGAARAPALSLRLGMAVGAALDVDRLFPPGKTNR